MLISGTGWTFQELDASPWPDVLDLLEYWRTSPPVHVLVRAYLGYEVPEEVQPMTDAEVQAWFQGIQGRSDV